jgi:hypothetical protein
MNSCKQSKSRKWKTPRLRTPKTQHHLTIQRSLISDLLGVNIDCYFNAWGRTMTARRLIDAIQTKHWTLHISRPHTVLYMFSQYHTSHRHAVLPRPRSTIPTVNLPSTARLIRAFLQDVSHHDVRFPYMWTQLALDVTTLRNLVRSAELPAARNLSNPHSAS